MSRVLVVGGGGVVGRRLVRNLLADDVPVEVVPTRVREAIDLVGVAPGAGDVVALATPGPHAGLAAELLAGGVGVVSVSDDLGDTRALLDLDDHARGHGATLVVGAAVSPGLCGLLTRHLSASMAVCDELHVAVHATAGPACARQHHRALRGRAVGWQDDTWIERPAGSGRELCWFPEPVGARDCYRAEMPAALLMHRSFPAARRISARMSATRRDRLTARLPMLRRPHPEGGVGALRVELRGADAGGARITLVAGMAEFVGTAAGAVAAAFAVAAWRRELPDGVVVASSADLDTGRLLERVERYGVRLQEFTGVPQRG